MVTPRPEDVASIGPAPGPLGPASALRTERHEARPGAIVVVPSGDVDAGTVKVFREAALDAVQTAARLVIIDLSGVTFMGSSGLAVLIEARAAAAEGGITCRPAAAPRTVRRVLELTGLDAALEHEESVEIGLRALD